MQDQYVSGGAAWFTLSLINAGLAQAKNRSGLNWWLISLFLGPVATLLIVAWPPAVAPSEAAADGQMGRTQAWIIGAVLVVVVVGVGLAAFAGTR
ncbi:MAG: hypothetical protein ABIW50_05250 [Candidatus Limnocylindria bacterium]